MNIEKISNEYIGDAAEIERQCFSSPWSEEQLAEEMKNDCAIFLVATENGSAVGYAVVYAVCGEGDIARVAVLPQYRKKGIARALLLEAFKAGLNDAFLDVRESNIPAISLYRSLGFEVIGTRKNYYKAPAENAVLMKKHFCR